VLSQTVGLPLFLGPFLSALLSFEAVNGSPTVPAFKLCFELQVDPLQDSPVFDPE